MKLYMNKAVLLSMAFLLMGCDIGSDDEKNYR